MSSTPKTIIEKMLCCCSTSKNIVEEDAFTSQEQMDGNTQESTSTNIADKPENLTTDEATASHQCAATSKTIVEEAEDALTAVQVATIDHLWQTYRSGDHEYNEDHTYRKNILVLVLVLLFLFLLSCSFVLQKMKKNKQEQVRI